MSEKINTPEANSGEALDVQSGREFIKEKQSSIEAFIDEYLDLTRNEKATNILLNAIATTTAIVGAKYAIDSEDLGVAGFTAMSSIGAFFSAWMQQHVLRMRNRNRDRLNS